MLSTSRAEIPTQIHWRQGALPLSYPVTSITAVKSKSILNPSDWWGGEQHEIFTVESEHCSSLMMPLATSFVRNRDGTNHHKTQPLKS